MTPDERLCDAAAGEDEEGVAAALADGADPNARLEGLTPALHLAVRCASVDMVEALLANGADPAMTYGDRATLEVARHVRKECEDPRYADGAARAAQLDRIIELLSEESVGTSLPPHAGGPMPMDNFVPEDFLPKAPASDAQIDLEAADLGWQIAFEELGFQEFSVEAFMSTGFGRDRVLRTLEILEHNGIVVRHGEDSYTFVQGFPEDAEVTLADPREPESEVTGDPANPDPGLALVGQHPDDVIWAKIWNAFGPGEFTFDELLDLDVGHEEANTALTFLKERGITETVGLRRFACRVPFAETQSTTIREEPNTTSDTLHEANEEAHRILSADDCSPSDLIRYGVVGGTLSEFGEHAALRLISGLTLEKLNTLFAESEHVPRLAGSSLMHLAVQLRSIPMMERLVEAGADFDLPNEAGVTPRELARNFLETYSTRELVDSKEAIADLKAIIQFMEPSSSKAVAPPAASLRTNPPRAVSKAEKKRRKELARKALAEAQARSRPWWKFWDYE